MPMLFSAACCGVNSYSASTPDTKIINFICITHKNAANPYCHAKMESSFVPAILFLTVSVDTWHNKSCVLLLE